MTSKEYIIEQLNEIRNLFPELVFRYQYREESLTHIVEVTPVNIFELNDEYVKVEAALTYDFDNKFYPENLLFVSDNSLTKIEDADFVFSVDKFGNEVDFLDESSIRTSYKEDELTKLDATTQQYALAA